MKFIVFHMRNTSNFCECEETVKTFESVDYEDLIEVIRYLESQIIQGTDWIQIQPLKEA